MTTVNRIVQSANGQDAIEWWRQAGTEKSALPVSQEALLLRDATRNAVGRVVYVMNGYRLSEEFGMADDGVRANFPAWTTLGYASAVFVDGGRLSPPTTDESDA